MTCVNCGCSLSADEVAVTKKLINRGAASFYCVDCLAAYFAVTPDDIRERIAYFKASGCTLFSTGVPDDSPCSSYGSNQLTL